MENNNNDNFYFGASSRQQQQRGIVDAVIFGSLQVSADSSTPYTDATQVSSNRGSNGLNVGFDRYKVRHVAVKNRQWENKES